MRTIIAGSRGCKDPQVLRQAILRVPWPISVVISGGAPGADLLGEAWAREAGLPLEVYPAPWGKMGKAAGRWRNTQMLQVADALVALWDGQSPGTAHMIRIATAAGKPVLVHHY